MPTGEQFRATGVIAVGMCDDNSFDSGRVKPNLLETPRHLAVTEPHVDQNTAVTLLEQRRIATAAAPEDRQSNRDGRTSPGHRHSGAPT